VPAWLVLGCGSPNPKVLADDQVEPTTPERAHGDLSEADKIRRVIDDVRASDATFLFGDRELAGPAAAEELAARVPRMSVATARQFVDTLTATAKSGESVRVRLVDGTVLSGHDWYTGRVEAIEGVPNKPRLSRVADPNAPSTITILDALGIVERSNKRFVAPQRVLPNGKTKGKRKEYTSSEFADMLRKKWEFLGADVRDVDTFVHEIASDAFSTMAPYRVVHEDGSEEEFRGWITAQIDARRAMIAKGGAP
jgi:hypothetical protein